MSLCNTRNKDGGTKKIRTCKSHRKENSQYYNSAHTHKRTKASRVKPTIPEFAFQPLHATMTQRTSIKYGGRRPMGGPDWGTKEQRPRHTWIAPLVNIVVVPLVVGRPSVICGPLCPVINAWNNTRRRG